MFKFILALVLVLSCGHHHAKNGTDGKSSLCQVKEDAGKKLLVCQNADGSLSELELKDGIDGSSPVVAHEACSVKLVNAGSPDVYLMSFNGASFSSGEVLSSLAYRRVKDNAVVFQASVLYAADDEVKAARKVETQVWAAEKVDGKAVLTHKASGSKFEMKCK